MICACPAARALATPFRSTLATTGLLLPQVTKSDSSCWVPSLKWPTARKVTLFPSTTEIVPGDTSSRDSRAAVTQISAEATRDK